ncbi:hypothetical protein BV22DRAFT_1103868 [Leucogyrophana mollusca]|uniref:Uncharacterized protein n=1 Tax=Leucogyrophana mollusca TaxID=85980 RepID=A0ACB8BPS2_9AGAM|nr:hypothetical protein BV22DRAFT_1103868 [Leucogyrophana mollusca]
MSDHDPEMEPESDDIDIEAVTELGNSLIQSILQKESLPSLQALIDDGAPLWYQDEDGTSALHAAAYVENARLVKLLIDEGAVWNAVDNLENTAGDISLSLNNEECYTIIRDAGIRSELLLSLLSSRSTISRTSSSFIIRDTDTSAAGSTDAFLSSRLRYTRDHRGQDICMLQLEDTEVGVMMGWEREIMHDTVEQLCSGHNKHERGLKILNVGFGLGIIDSFFQMHTPRTPPSLHVIIEPHPDVLQYMREQGWYEKAGVVILEGKWQDFIESEALLGYGGFDAIYTDTFSEDYEALHDFFKHLPDLLAGPDSKFSFFNGLGATNALFYDVYTRLSELHLSDVGLDVQWSDVDVSAQDSEERWGETRKYFTLPRYRLPIAKMRQT